VLEQIWAGPELALGLTRNANPWDFRDKIRMNCLNLLAKARRARGARAFFSFLSRPPRAP